MRVRPVWLAAAAMSLVMAAGAQAQDTEAPPAEEMTPQERFVELHGAVVAYERCTGIHFDEQQAMALNQRIRELIGESFGAGATLQLIYDAREAMTRRVTSEGCGGDRVTDALTLFETNLADAVSMAGSQ
ncbi:MAG: hypothetical protein H6842_05955 [Rhodospirillaceae bacterium]|nr:hypothetical protein [Rhodospirillaceae bacterium]